MQQSFARIKGVIEQIKCRAWLSSSPSIGCAVLQIDAAVTCCRIAEVEPVRPMVSWTRAGGFAE